MITLARFRDIEAAVRQAGYGEDIARSELLTRPATATQFAAETIYVIVNSGMRNSVARGIFQRCMKALRKSNTCRAVFGHPGKAIAIDDIWRRRRSLFRAFNLAEDPVAFLATLPWIGPVTKFHLAKNFGGNFAKPDVHLNRLAAAEGVDAQTLCDRLSAQTGYRASTIDLILWRACADGIIDSRSFQHDDSNAPPVDDDQSLIEPIRDGQGGSVEGVATNE